MRYIALLSMPGYLEQYCRFRGGTFDMPDGEEAVSIGFNTIASRWLSKYLIPYASEDVARAKGLLPPIGSKNGRESWVRIGVKSLQNPQNKAVNETKDTVYVLGNFGKSIILEAIQIVFDTTLIEDWQKTCADYNKTYMLPTKKLFINAWLESNGITVGDTEFEAVMKRLTRLLNAARECVEQT